MDGAGSDRWSEEEEFWALTAHMVKDKSIPDTKEDAAGVEEEVHHGGDELVLVYHPILLDAHDCRLHILLCQFGIQQYLNWHLQTKLLPQNRLYRLHKLEHFFSLIRWGREHFRKLLTR